MAGVNEVMLMGEQATREYMLTADLETLKKTPRMATDNELAPDVQAAYVAGYHNGSLDIARESLKIINDANQAMIDTVKVYEMPPTEPKKHTGAKFLLLTAVVGGAVYLYKKHKKKQADIDDIDDDFFDDDESERPEE